MSGVMGISPLVSYGLPRAAILPPPTVEASKVVQQECAIRLSGLGTVWWWRTIGCERSPDITSSSFPTADISVLSTGRSDARGIERASGLCCGRSAAKAVARSRPQRRCVRGGCISSPSDAWAGEAWLGWPTTCSRLSRRSAAGVRRRAGIIAPNAGESGRPALGRVVWR
jgi:hypothetical protein